jgi:ubiquinone/menaquinone biosynthesis C-methylase UbiE
VLDIPDLRVFAGPYIDLEDDRNKGLKLAATFDSLTFQELVSYYYSITPAVPAHDARRYVRGVMAGIARAEAQLDSWESAKSGGFRPRQASFLDLGCGTAPLSIAATKRYKVVAGVDIAFRWLVVAKKRVAEMGLDIPLICACAEALPFPNESFDCVAADSVVEHLRDQKLALKECHRVLCAGGYLYLSTPNRHSLGPDPQIGLWGGGFLPAAWINAYVRRQNGLPPQRRLLTLWELSSLIQKAGFSAPRSIAPEVSAEQRRHFGRGMQLGIDLYRLARHVPLSRTLLLTIGPLINVVAVKPDAVAAKPAM